MTSKRENDRRNPVLQERAPHLTPEFAAHFLEERYDLTGTVELLASYVDQNFRIVEPSGASWVLKISNAAEDAGELDLQHRVLERLAEAVPGVSPMVRRSRADREIESIPGRGGREHLARVVSFLDGPLLAAHSAVSDETWLDLGRLLARVDVALHSFEHPKMHRTLRWDLAQASWCAGLSREISAPARRTLIERAQIQFFGDVHRRLDVLPKQVIYNDANPDNLTVTIEAGNPRVRGMFDFGDTIHSARVFELAVAAAYAVFDRPRPLEVLSALVRGYHEECPLDECELETLLPSVQMRLVLSVLISECDGRAAPDNEYIRVSEDRAWNALEALDSIEPNDALEQFRSVCGREQSPPRPDGSALFERRTRHVGPALSLAYRNPLHIVRGRGQYLFDANGRAYLDGVNNIAHVGHCHPRVVAAATEQIAALNTNTRYLHESLVRYAERLAGLFPAPLEVCTFVNSGSEANELAIRMARAQTGRHAILSLVSGYHGNTTTLIDVSSYKHDGPGGAGAPEWVYTAPCPDAVRGVHIGPGAKDRYVEEIARQCEQAAADGRPIAGFIAESIIGCGGQVVPPEGFLREAFEVARAAGAVAIADEVQVGFGRTGAHLWAFAAQGATPDIVTLGKPIGNGHPLAAVVTTREIASSFAGGMEFFSSFGGNPVSCSVGLAVLDVLEEEGLPEHASAMGARLLDGLEVLRGRHEAISDVRGLGLYLGVELSRRVQNELCPATDLAARVVELARQSGVLLSTDGPHRNVLKLKPPLPIRPEECDLLLAVLDRALLFL